MKFATLKADGRDGRLVLVSRDLTSAVEADAAPTLQAALDRWDTVKDALEAQYRALNAGAAADAHPFDAALSVAGRLGRGRRIGQGVALMFARQDAHVVGDIDAVGAEETVEIARGEPGHHQPPFRSRRS